MLLWILTQTKRNESHVGKPCRVGLVGLSCANEEDLKSQAISVISTDYNYHTIFARGIDSKIYFNNYYGNWGNWIALSPDATLFISAPSAVKDNSNSFHIFAIDTNNHLRHLTLNENGGSWSQWDDLGGNYLPIVRAGIINSDTVSAGVLDLGKRGYVHSLTLSTRPGPHNP